MYQSDEFEGDLDLDWQSNQLRTKMEILNNSLESLGLRALTVDSSLQPNKQEVLERIKDVRQLLKDAEEESAKSMEIEQELSHKIEQLNEQIV